MTNATKSSALASPTVRWAVERTLGGGEVVRLGTVRWVGDGYRFVPSVPGRRPSRKSFGSLSDALPRWVGYPNRCETRGLP